MGVLLQDGVSGLAAVELLPVKLDASQATAYD